MLILLPPSEGKTAPRRGRPMDLRTMADLELTDARAQVVEALVSMCRDDPDGASRTLGLGVTQHGEVARNAALWRAPTARADRVYSGVLYQELDLTSLDGAARRRATAWVAVASGLLGLVRPTDRIPAYRLSGEVALPGVGPLATFWGRFLDPVVRAAAGSGLVLDLRSSAYAPFWRPGPELAGRVVTVRVLQQAAGTRTVVSHLNKATKGRILRSLVQDGAAPRTPRRLAEQLSTLGWEVELGPAARTGTRLDVVVGAVSPASPPVRRGC